jgi:hypothetical protein
LAVFRPFFVPGTGTPGAGISRQVVVDVLGNYA